MPEFVLWNTVLGTPIVALLSLIATYATARGNFRLLKRILVMFIVVAIITVPIAVAGVVAMLNT